MLLQVSGLRKLYGGDVVLDGASLRLDRREKVALVGRNGCGKTTLLRILTGELEADGGSVTLGRGVSLGYLSQQSRLREDRTVIQTAEEARAHLVDLERRLRELEAQLEHEPSQEDLDEYAMLHEHFFAEGGYSVERDVRTVLARMGFEEDELGKPVAALSGGEKTRLQIAKLLLEEPDLLILDEPTNHLDLEAIEWLEGWIRGYGGAVLVVSHDRTFLQSVAQRLIEMRDGRCASYPGPYEKYLRLRRDEDARVAELAMRQQAEIDKLDEYVRRFMNSQRTAQARGRLKQMEKLQASKVEAPKKAKQMAGGFAKAQRTGDVVFACESLGMRFGDQRLFEGLDWTVRWGDRWGVIGANGAGKSTLLRAMTGELSPTEGRARTGSNVNLGFFAQDARMVDPEMSPLQVVRDFGGMPEAQSRNLLGKFLISGDDALRPVKTLSGGERVKVALALITAQEPNVLMLDEPTNHLDVDSREALADVLGEFTGTLIVVSHDRWLLNQVTTQTLDVRHDGTYQYNAPYDEYRAWRAAGRPVAQTGTPRPREAESIVPDLSPRELSKEIARLAKAVVDVETRVEAAEAALRTLEARMAAPDPADDLVAMSHQHADLQTQVRAAMDLWAEEASRLEALRAKQG